MPVVYRRCPRCGFPLAALDRYCGACGFRASRPCPRCDHEIASDLPFCNYCGQPLVPVEVSDKLPHPERLKLLHASEAKAFEEKAEELRRRLLFLRRKSLLKRGVELAVFFVVLSGLVFWGAPLLDSKWKAFFSQSPARAMLLSFLFSVLLILIVGYILQARQIQDSAEADELRTRLFLARERSEEARERADEWDRVSYETPKKQQNQEPAKEEG